MRWFAMYLPQFHETAENNEWWGKGFTEWTHVNAAKPLYHGHLQPIAPKDGNYYDLMDKQTVLWQTNLMKQYGVDGFVYYHYYFRGQKLLEKPALALAVQADAAIDIGDTLVGMHIRPVAVPLRIEYGSVGHANLVMAYSRLPYVGGSRAVYE